MANKQYCCLLVDDDPEDQETFLYALQKASTTTGCYVVDNAQDALFTLLNTDLQPDYIFTDLNMPRMNGLQFIETVRSIEKFKHIPIIVYSSEFAEDVIDRVMCAGANAFHSKTHAKALIDILKKYFSQCPSGISIL